MSGLEKSREILSSYLKEVSHKTGHNLKLNENDLCGLDCKGGLTCGVVLLGEKRIGFFSPVLDMKGLDKEELFNDILGLNLFSLEPPGSSIAYDETGNQIIFCLPLAIESLSSDIFSEQLGLFIKAAGAVKDDIKAMVQNTKTNRSHDISDRDNNFQYIRV